MHSVATSARTLLISRINQPTRGVHAGLPGCKAWLPTKRRTSPTPPLVHGRSGTTASPAAARHRAVSRGDQRPGETQTAPGLAYLDQSTFGPDIRVVSHFAGRFHRQRVPRHTPRRPSTGSATSLPTSSGRASRAGAVRPAGAGQALSPSRRGRRGSWGPMRVGCTISRCRPRRDPSSPCSRRRPGEALEGRDGKPEPAPT